MCIPNIYQKDNNSKKKTICINNISTESYKVTEFLYKFEICVDNK